MRIRSTWGLGILPSEGMGGEALYPEEVCYASTLYGGEGGEISYWDTVALVVLIS